MGWKVLLEKYDKLESALGKIEKLESPISAFQPHVFQHKTFHLFTIATFFNYMLAWFVTKT